MKGFESDEYVRAVRFLLEEQGYMEPTRTDEDDDESDDDEDESDDDDESGDIAGTGEDS
jgi:hypothetical protein